MISLSFNGVMKFIISVSVMRARKINLTLLVYGGESAHKDLYFTFTILLKLRVEFDLQCYVQLNPIVDNRFIYFIYFIDLTIFYKWFCNSLSPCAIIHFSEGWSHCSKIGRYIFRTTSKVFLRKCQTAAATS